MSTQTADTTVRSSVVVHAPVERAFRVFTEDFGAFKPPSHNLLPASSTATATCVSHSPRAEARTFQGRR